MEIFAQTYSQLYNIPIVGLRFFTVYGPRGRPDMAPYKFMDAIHNNKPLTQFGDGTSSRDYTYVDDIVSGTKSAIENNYQCEVFNLGNNNSEKLMDMIGIIEDEIGQKAIIEYCPMQPGDVKESFADIDYSQKMLGYSPKTSINEGIPKFIQWFKMHHKI